MTSRDFVYWAQGFFELADPHSLSQEQINTIKNHLNMVFVHEIDPSMGDKKMQDALNAAHKIELAPDYKLPPYPAPLGPDGGGGTFRC